MSIFPVLLKLPAVLLRRFFTTHDVAVRKFALQKCGGKHRHGKSFPACFFSCFLPPLHPLPFLNSQTPSPRLYTTLLFLYVLYTVQSTHSHPKFVIYLYLPNPSVFFLRSPALYYYPSESLASFCQHLSLFAWLNTLTFHPYNAPTILAHTHVPHTDLIPTHTYF